MRQLLSILLSAGPPDRRGILNPKGPRRLGAPRRRKSTHALPKSTGVPRPASRVTDSATNPIIGAVAIFEFSGLRTERGLLLTAANVKRPC